MTTIARIIGGAGTGKTTRLLDLMGRTIEAGGVDPTDIGFVSFTRAARAEAAGRAAEQFGIPRHQLEAAGWFRTLHSVCKRVLGVGGELLAGRAADRKWIGDALNEQVTGSASDDDNALGASGAFETGGEADLALRIWDVSRSRCESLRDSHARMCHADGRAPAYDYCLSVAERYEQAKRLDHRVDFTDLLALVGGWRFTPSGGPERVEPDGELPELPIWFFDEQQDTSRLLDSVCRRLIDTAKWVYVVGDPFQGIFSWAGAEPNLFLSWAASKQEILRTSYRCPAPILDLGEEIIRECSDYFDRGIKPTDKPGDVDAMHVATAIREVDPTQSWLLLARTNFQARRLAHWLDKLGIPWAPNRGAGGWNAPVRNEALIALHTLQRGGPIDGGQWVQVLKLLPSKVDGEELLVWGTKARWAEMDRPAEQFAWVQLSDERFPTDMGSTLALTAAIRSGRWLNFIEGADKFSAAIDQWGEDVVTKPRVKIGTIHSAKGQEADNVLWLTTTSQQVARGQETQEGIDAEQRVSYVAATRARERLIVARERCFYQSRVPA